MPAIDSIGNFQTTVASTYAAGVMATGDSATVRSTALTDQPQLTDIMSDHVTTALPFRVRSPLLHDNVRGLTFIPTATPSGPLMPGMFSQPLQPQDTLIFEESTAAATGKAAVVAQIYYPNLPGGSARLHMAGEIDPLVKSIKPLIIVLPITTTTAGQWYDLVITTTEDTLHANTDYAVLGLLTDTGICAVAVKGIDTANLRIACPGVLRPETTSQYFRDRSVESGLPLIPVINSANKNGTFVSFFQSVQNAAAISIVLMLAELKTNLSS